MWEEVTCGDEVTACDGTWGADCSADVEGADAALDEEAEGAGAVLEEEGAGEGGGDDDVGEMAFESFEATQGAPRGERLPADDAWDLGDAPELGGAEELEAVLPMADDAAITAQLWAEAEGFAEDAGILGADGEAPQPLAPGLVESPEPDAAPAARAEPFPALAQFYRASRGSRGGGRMRADRYFDAQQLHRDMSDDGHLSRWAAKSVCLVCLDMTHQMRDCCYRRCALCFCSGHSAFDCPDMLTSDATQVKLADCLQEALDALGAGEEAESHGTGEVESAASTLAGSPEAACDALAGAPEPGTASASPVAAADLAEQPAAEQQPAPAVRCVACGACGVGHVNCAAPPAYDFMNEAIANVAGDAAKVPFQAVDDVAETLAQWARPSPEQLPLYTAGGSAAALEGAVLRFLGEGAVGDGALAEELRKVPESALRRASRRLRRLRALGVPGCCGGAPEVTPLGWWLSQLPVQPATAVALLHGALWGVLLPVAVLVVLLESMPPDMAFGGGALPPRKSGHLALLAAYFRWREGRQTGLARFGADFFWEAVDQRVVAICKHAQQMLGYDGDDAAFEEMDGELMDVRRNDGRPWTLASALGGSETSPRWARFCAALAAAFPPRLTAQGWVVSTSEPMLLETVVSSGHALIFSPSEPKLLSSSPARVEVDGIDCTLIRGDGAYEEALSLRGRLAERLQRALDGGGRACEAVVAAVMEERDIASVLVFLGNGSGEVVPPAFVPEDADATTEGICLGMLKLLGRGDEAGALAAAEGSVASQPLPEPEPLAEEERALGLPPNLAASLGIEEALAAGQAAALAAAPAVAGDSDADAGTEEEGHFGRWVLALAGLALVEALKSRSVEAEDFDAALRLKAGEEALRSAAAEGRRQALQDSTVEREAALARLSQRKRKAVADEDFDLAARIKRREVALAARSDLPKSGALERLLVEKAEAVAAEDFDRAAELRRRQSSWEAALGRFEGEGLARAQALAAAEAGRRQILEAVANVSDADFAGDAVDEGLWSKVQLDLKAQAVRSVK